MLRNREAEPNNLESDPLLPLAEVRRLLDIVCLFNALLQSGGNLSSAAKELGIGRRTLYDLMEKHGISYTDGRLSIELVPLLCQLELRTVHIERFLT